jgi:hypothetical protein
MLLLLPTCTNNPLHSSCSYIGAGIIVDIEIGLVLVDKSTVPIGLGDVLITIAAAIEIPGSVVFVHPVQNFAVIKYDPKLLGATPVQAAELNAEPLEVGATTSFVGITHHFTMVYQKATVTKIDRLTLRDCHPPQFRATNVDVVHFDRVTKNVGGCFADADGKVVALWQAFSFQEDGEHKEAFRGLPTHSVMAVVEALRAGESPVVSSLACELLPIALAKARAGMNLPEHWCQKLEQICGSKVLPLTLDFDGLASMASPPWPRLDGLA